MNKNLISPIAGLAILLFFFAAPWVSCGNMMTWSGNELAQGTSGGMMGDMGGGKDGFEGDPLLWIVPLAGVAIAALYFVFKNKNRLASAFMPTMAIAVLGLLVMVLTFMKVQSKQSEFTDGMSDVGSSLGSLGDSSSGEKAEPSSSDGDFGKMMSGMGLKIEWGFWLTAIAFGAAAFGATKYRDQPQPLVSTEASIAESTSEVVPSNPPPDASMTEDKGMG